MKKTICLLTIATLLMLSGTSSTVFAGKIYKWTDSDGKVHYGERPPSGQGKQMRVPRSTSYGAPTAPKANNSSNAANKFLESVAAERKEKKAADDKMAQEKEITDKNCSNARKRVAGLSFGGRKYEVTEKGERNYLDDASIQKRLKEAQKMVKKWCK